MPNWRPEEWQKIKQAILPLRMEPLDPIPFKLIEAGADAMLEAVNEHMNELPDFVEWASQWARDNGWVEPR